MRGLWKAGKQREGGKTRYEGVDAKMLSRAENTLIEMGRLIMVVINELTLT